MTLWRGQEDETLWRGQGMKKAPGVIRGPGWGGGISSCAPPAAVREACDNRGFVCPRGLRPIRPATR